jgi:hypothetical protein
VSARLCLCLVVVAVCLGGAAPALADGLPVLGVDVGSKGLVSPGGHARYVTLPAGRTTTLAQTATTGGRVLRWAGLVGTWTIPAVAYDGSASGLSADGRTLVLIEPRVSFPRARTRFLVVDTKKFGIVDARVTLRGDFSFDALSPDGLTMYLIQYYSPDPTRYHVRAYDLANLRLLPKPIVDPRETGDEMRGAPLTRATSPDGRWAYTLYDGAGGTPFVHALDTKMKRARCIDMPMLIGRRDLWQLKLDVSRGGRLLAVRSAAKTVGLVNTRTFAAWRPKPPVAQSGGGTSKTWPIAGGIAFVALLGALFGLRRLRPRPETAQATTR